MNMDSWKQLHSRGKEWLALYSRGRCIWAKEKTITGTTPLQGIPMQRKSIKSWSLKGNEEHTGTAAPTSPIDIQGVGDNTMSANDAFKVINGYLSWGTEIVADNDNRTLVYKLEPNTKYHISLEKRNSSSDDIVYSFASKEPNIGDSVTVGHIYPAVSGHNSYSFDITTDSTNIWLCLKLCKVSITDFDLAWNSVKIVGGGYKVTTTNRGKNLLNLNNFVMTTASYTNRLDSVTNEALINTFHNNEYDMTYSCEKTSTISSGRPSGTVAFFTANHSAILVVTPDSVVPAHTDLSQTDYIYLYGNNDASEVTISKLQLELGSTATAYEPYREPITTTVYLGQTQTVRKIGKLVFTGNEAWSFSTGSGHNRAFLSTWRAALGASLPLCTHYKGVDGGGGYPAEGVCLINSNGTPIFNADFVVDITEWIAYLAAQYAAGTPVTVWYVLATPETAIVNEPLMKIGNYADELRSTEAGVSIPTAEGTNVFDTSTTVKPSSMTLTYR